MNEKGFSKKGHCPKCNKFKSLHLKGEEFLCAKCYKAAKIETPHEGSILAKAKVHTNEDLKRYNRKRRKKDQKKELDKEV